MGQEDSECRKSISTSVEEVDVGQNRREYLEHDDNTLLTNSEVFVTFYPLSQRLMTTLHINRTSTK